MKNLLLILCISFLFGGCKAQQEYSADEIKNSASTHKVKEPLIIEAIDHFITGKEIAEDEFIDVYISGGGSFNCYDIQLSISNFELEKDYRSFFNQKKSNNKLKGYFKYNYYLVVLQGDIKNFFSCISPCQVKNIFHRHEPFDNILPIYEPSVYEYEICNQTLGFKGLKN